MQPACQHLPIVPGTTYRDTVRLMQPVFKYQPITAISGAPVLLTVPAHGLSDTWPIWVRGVRGMPELNAEPVRQNPHRAVVVDADTLQINRLSATNLTPLGGELIYKLPIDLTGAQVTRWKQPHRCTSITSKVPIATGLSSKTTAEPSAKTHTPPPAPLALTHRWLAPAQATA